MPTIAVIGASADRSKFGNRCVRAYRQQGWTVYPVNPREKQIEGLVAFPSILDVPAGTIDRVSVYLPAAVGVKIIDEIARRGDVVEVMLNPGADDDEVVEKAKLLGLYVVTGCSLVAIGAH
ncbi:MAG: CoA-binding protein [Planctomycetes bacterium]|nr:CoA-binding protein [Planctomycetota bacterium]